MNKVKNKSSYKIFQDQKNNYGVLTEGINAWTLVNPKLKTKGLRVKMAI